LIQYREKLDFLARGLELVANLYHQDQRSNLGLFETIDTSIEVGLSWRF